MLVNRSVNSKGSLVCTPRLGLAIAVLVISSLASLAGVSHIQLLAIPILAGVSLLVYAIAGGVEKTFALVFPALLVGYAFFGRGFAYVGHDPVFVGEIVLLAGIVALLATSRSYGKPWGVASKFLFVFMCVGLINTLMNLRSYGVFALRDSAVWTYGAFAFIVPSVLSRSGLDRLVGIYAKLIPAFVLWVPLAGTAFFLRQDLIPYTPGTSVPFVYFKGGDMAVHLAGISAFLLLGLYQIRKPSVGLSELAIWVLWSAGAAFVLVGRASLLVLTIGILLSIWLRKRTQLPRESANSSPNIGFRSIGQLTLVATALLVFGAVVGPRLDIGADREISVRQIQENLATIIGGGDDRNVGTREWRLNWWGQIIEYTFQGPYLLTGKGFGINLAVDDGIPNPGDVRSPHNVSMTILARMGVPGLVLWLGFLASFTTSLLRAISELKRRNSFELSLVASWILVYWICMVVNATFDPYIEGPHGGIWFWAVTGLGLTVVQLTADGKNRISSGIRLSSNGREASPNLR